MTLDPQAALVICRVLHDGSAMALWGAFGFLVALVPAGLADAVGRRLSGPRRGGIAIAVATTIAALPLEAAAIGEGWADALDPTTLAAVLFETSVGHAWQAQMLSALLLAAALFAPERWRHRATTIAAGLLLATLALTGHAAKHQGALGAAHRLNDAVHVLAGGAWLGALVPLLMILQARGTSATRAQAGIALRRFSTAGHAAVALVIATGAINTLLVLGRWPTDPASPYQLLLAVKIAIVCVMTILALANRYVLVPRMARDPEGSLGTLRLATLAEIGLGLAALVCVSVFGLLEPA